MFENDFDKLIQEGGTIRRTPSGEGYRYSPYDTSYDERKEFRKMAKLYEGLIYLRKEMKHMTKTQIIDRLAESYNYLAEIYDTIEDDYTEAPVKTSRLGFAKRPKRTSKHRRDIDRLIYEIRRNIIDLNGRGWNRTACKEVIDKMLEVFEYEQRELGSIEHFGDRKVNTVVSKATHKVLEKIMDGFVDEVYEDIYQESDHESNDKCISYAMGVDDSIYELEDEGFKIDEDDGDYCVTFDKSKSKKWEAYIKKHLKDEYWNEYIYLPDLTIHFMINEDGRIKHVENHHYEEDEELLSTCNRLCDGNFKTIRELIYSNSFYKKELKKLEKQSDFYRESHSPRKRERRKNDKGEDVPEECDECGSKVGIVLKGEPIWQCTNKKCKKYFGTVECHIQESATGDTYWRFTYKGKGIYEALKQAMWKKTESTEAWTKFKNSDACDWLPEPPSYGKDNYSYFTKKGYDMFMKKTYPIMVKYLGEENIEVEKYKLDDPEIVYEDEYQIVVEEQSKPVQESWNDRKNGVNPKSKKMAFHVSRDSNLDGSLLRPRVPEYITKEANKDKNDPYYEDPDIPRVCFSPSIEGCLNAIINKGDRHRLGNQQLYVYVPEKPLSEYKTKSNKELYKNGHVFDAKSTGEIWILEPVRLRLYGTITVDQISDRHLHDVANKNSKIPMYDYKWHWQTKPKIYKDHETGELGTCKKVKDFPFDKVYFGTHQRYENGIDLDRPLFITPYKRLASIFAVSHDKKKLELPYGDYNLGFDEWKNMTKENQDDYLDTVHIRIEGMPDIKEYEVDATGYVYEIDVSELKNYIYQYTWMDMEKEFLIDGIDHIDGVEKKLNIKCIIKGYPRHHHTVNESYIMESSDEKSFKHTKKICEELVDHLDDFKYGIPRKDGKIHHVKSAKDYDENYHLLSPDEFVKYRGGVCWDYVEYEEKWLKEHGIECRKFYIITETPPNYDTHTIVVVSVGGKHIWIESSFKKLAGVRVFDNLKDIFKVITYTMFQFNGNKHRFHQFKYSVMEYTNKSPKYGCNCDEFMDFMVENAKLVFDDVAKQDHPYKLEDYVQESVDVNELRQQCNEIFQQCSQMKYGCLDENGERIVASPFKDSWQMISKYRSQSMETFEESKMGVCYEHSAYVAKQLKERGLPYQTFFLNANIQVESNPSLNYVFWHQFTIVPNDADSVVLIETSLTPDKNGVFLVQNMDDAINHLIQSFNLNLSQEQLEGMQRDLLDVSMMEMKNDDSYLGYIQNVYRNGKLIEDNIRIKHRTEIMKLYWDYLNEHDYLTEDGKNIYEQIKNVDDDFRFEIQALSPIKELFTEEGNKFNDDFGIMDPDVFFELTPSDMESKLKGFIQESFMNLKHNSLKADFNEIPLRPSTAKQYAHQGVFDRNLGRIHLTPHTHGSIFVDENGVTVAYLAVEKKTDGNRWITGMEVSHEFKHPKKEDDPYEGMDTLIGFRRPDDDDDIRSKDDEPIDFTIQLLQIAVDEYHANRMMITKNNLENLYMLQEQGWEIEKESDGKIILAFNHKSNKEDKDGD